jgi:hypothetical protein
MQKFFLQFAGLAIALTLVLAMGCTTEPEDEGPIDNPLPPIIRFVSEAGFLDADAEVSAGEVFKVKLSADIGDKQLNALTINEDGAKLSTDRFEVNGGAIVSNNPFLIVGDDKDGATWEIAITSDADFNTVRSYEFVVEDEDGLSDAVSLTITTKGIPVDQSISGVLLNQAGPAGTGGLDLDTGDGTGSADAASEIRDLGIDCTIDPASAENWRAQIGTINGADMVKVDLTVVEGFDYDAVDTKEAITAAYDSGITLADGVSQNASCDETAVTDVSDPVVVGDLFIVFANDTYYLIRVDEVNAVDSSNGDNIVVSIKY